MLQRAGNLSGLLRATSLLRGTSKPLIVLKRNTQVGNVICTPPRVRVSYAEKVGHMMFMLIVWLSPVAYFMTQIKVWRREYVED